MEWKSLVPCAWKHANFVVRQKLTRIKWQIPTQSKECSLFGRNGGDAALRVEKVSWSGIVPVNLHISNSKILFALAYRWKRTVVCQNLAFPKVCSSCIRYLINWLEFFFDRGSIHWLSDVLVQWKKLMIKKLLLYIFVHLISVTDPNTELCEDKSERCESWKNKGFCLETYTLYMRKNCAKSCGVCGGKQKSHLHIDSI